MDVENLSIPRISSPERHNDDCKKGRNAIFFILSILPLRDIPQRSIPKSTSLMAMAGSLT